MAPQKPHKTIFLQNWGDPNLDDVTWCEDKCNPDDVEYILKSEYDKLATELGLSTEYANRQKKYGDDLEKIILKTVANLEKINKKFTPTPILDQDIDKLFTKILGLPNEQE